MTQLIHCFFFLLPVTTVQFIGSMMKLIDQLLWCSRTCGWRTAQNTLCNTGAPHHFRAEECNCQVYDPGAPRISARSRLLIRFTGTVTVVNYFVKRKMPKRLIGVRPEFSQFRHSTVHQTSRTSAPYRLDSEKQRMRFRERDIHPVTCTSDPAL